jgi:hypothetical protein
MLGPIVDITIIRCVSSTIFNFNHTPEAKIHITPYILYKHNDLFSKKKVNTEIFFQDLPDPSNASNLAIQNDSNQELVDRSGFYTISNLKALAICILVLN